MRNVGLGSQHKTLWTLAFLSLVLAFFIIGAEVLAPTVSLPINAAEIRHDQGFAYITSLRKRPSFLYRLQSDWIDRTDSSLILYENGKPLGPAHSAHDEIRKHGAGRFSHWGTALWLSSIDGTDPRTNGRSYEAKATLSVRLRWILAGTVFLLAGLTFVVFRVARQPSGRQFLAGLPRLAGSWSLPRSYGNLQTALIGLVGTVCCGGAVIYGWYLGDTSTTGLEVARFFPVSDAFGYHSCATSIAAAGRFDEPFGSAWCARRVLYPAMLASLFSLTAWSSQLALICQGALVGVAIAAFSVTVSSFAGPLAALLAASLLFLYAWEFVLGLFMTEVLGFTLGLCGLALLLNFCKTKASWQLLAGAAFISIALAARAGALFALPILPAWALLAFPGIGVAQRGRLFLIAFFGVLAGPLLQLVTVLLLGGDASNTGGNYSASLFGLSTGSRDWSQAYREFEPLFRRSESEAFQQIYSAAWENIRHSPDVFIGSLGEAARLYFVSLFSFVSAYRSNELLTALAALGVVLCIFAPQRPEARLLLALAMAEVFAAPLIIDSGGIRVFAVTVPLRILLCAVGVQGLMLLLLRAIEGIRIGTSYALDAKPARLLAAGIGTALVVLIAAPATPLAAFGRLAVVAGRGCPLGLKEVVARLEQESQSLTIVQASTAIESIDPFRISPQRLRNDSRIAATWFGKDFLNISPPFSIIRAVDLSAPAASAVKPLAYAGQLPTLKGIQSLCVDESAYVNIGEVRHHLIKEIRPIGEVR